MQLADYIREIGVSEFAKRFMVTERAAISYLYGDRRPRAKLAQRIVNGSPVTWDGIYADTSLPARQRAS